MMDDYTLNRAVYQVACEACGGLHEVDDKTYISIHGNVHIGRHGGVIGNGIDPATGKVNAMYVYCRDQTECLTTLVQTMTNRDDVGVEVGEKYAPKPTRVEW